MDRKLIFVKRDIGRAREILKSNGVKTYLIRDNFDGEFVLGVKSAAFDRAKELLTAAGIVITRTASHQW